MYMTSKIIALSLLYAMLIQGSDAPTLKSLLDHRSNLLEKRAGIKEDLQTEENRNTELRIDDTDLIEIFKGQLKDIETELKECNEELIRTLNSKQQ
jgi:hypothetical protein